MLDRNRKTPPRGWNSYDGYINRVSYNECLENLEYFIQTEQTAIQNIKSSFSELEIAYGIDIPDAEIKYLSDILLESH